MKIKTQVGLFDIEASFDHEDEESLESFILFTKKLFSKHDKDLANIANLNKVTNKHQEVTAD